MLKGMILSWQLKPPPKETNFYGDSLFTLNPEHMFV
jgi:hypothetical protein